MCGGEILALCCLAACCSACCSCCCPACCADDDNRESARPAQVSSSGKTSYSYPKSTGGYYSGGGGGTTTSTPARDNSGMAANIAQMQAGYVQDGVPPYQVPYSSYTGQ
ncbi:hypothetical protein QBC47DRAFT_366294 [Echria macrotheca]|uniref:Uncharacterized protein n=1 Tax=Echria macrotheca TaxID=438768 RepID=A0AAJ0FAF5_9PEZI|nr:hypothetical protein QBC47DRAFT_366294 [Echria macrotheca]